MGLQPPTIADAERIARIIVDEFAPERVVLFGSVARGEQHPNSDVDLMVVMPEDCDRAATMSALSLAMFRHRVDVPVDFYVTTSSSLVRYGESIGLVYRQVAIDGRDLYAA